MTPLSLDMDSNDLHDWIASNGPVHVVFSAGSENFEGYPEDGIQALITGVLKKDPEFYTWVVDYTPFEVVNSLHESTTYYGSAPTPNGEKRKGCLQAYATIFYKRQDTIYVEPTDKLRKTMHSIQPASALAVTADAVEQRFAELQKELGGFSI